ncbi:kinase-like domain-containing protein [Gorgonomyces haynaldii]|nr:kinase-like domain-containing protein [Gorgonomyces haynaldii]
MGCSASTPLAPVKTIQDFESPKLISKGSDGFIFLLQEKASGRLFAAKRISTAKPQSVLDAVLLERSILEAMHHPFINNLKLSFEDGGFWWLLLDYHATGTLARHLALHSWTEEEARVVIAQMVSALVYIHSLHIVHLDVTPQNILMDRHGHCYLSDFGSSKMLPLQQGEPYKGNNWEYISPEVSIGTSHTHTPDIWSLGVVLYEMLFGHLPFYGKFFEIMMAKGKVDIPKEPLVSTECASFLEGCMTILPERRLGSVHTAQLMAHPWFRNIQFTKQKMKPLYVPVSKWNIKPRLPSVAADMEKMALKECGREKLYFPVDLFIVVL